MKNNGKFDKWVNYSEEHGMLFKSVVLLNKSKVCVEIGVAHGTTSKWICEGAQAVGGHLYGFDIWDIHGEKPETNDQYVSEWIEKHGSRLKHKKEYGQIGSKEAVELYLRENKLKAFTMTQTDTRDSGFPEVVKTVLKGQKVDFAFIDGDHSYNGIKRDFDAIYGLLSDTGVVAFHDTMKIDGCREFMLDLRTKYFDGTYDVVDFPFGNGGRRVGVSLLVKRTYPVIGHLLDEMCGSPSLPHEIMEKERAWYENELKQYKK
jgi:hypothetical protein